MEFLPFLDYIYHVMVVMIDDHDEDLPFLDYVDHVMVVMVKTCPFWMT